MLILLEVTKNQPYISRHWSHGYRFSQITEHHADTGISLFANDHNIRIPWPFYHALLLLRDRINRKKLKRIVLHQIIPVTSVADLMYMYCEWSSCMSNTQGSASSSSSSSSSSASSSGVGGSRT